MFASTKLVVELGIILYLLMGWQVMVGEWIGGVVLVVILTCLVRLTYPKKLVEEARRHPEARSGHEHGGMTAEGSTVWAKLTRRETWVLVAQNFAMELVHAVEGFAAWIHYRGCPIGVSAGWRLASPLRLGAQAPGSRCRRTLSLRQS
jgi:hypothetical protein